MPVHEGKSGKVRCRSISNDQSRSVFDYQPRDRDRGRLISVCVWAVLPRRLSYAQLYGAVDLPSSAFCCCWSGFRKFRPTAFLSRTGEQGKVPSVTQLASLLANQHQCAKEELKCLLRAQATLGVALTNNGSTSRAIQLFTVHTGHFLDREWELWSRISSLRREITTHTADNLATVSRGVVKRFELFEWPAWGVSESYQRNRNEAANKVAAGNHRDEADRRESQPAPDHYTGWRDVQLWLKIIMASSFCLLFANTTGPVSLLNNR